MRRHPVALMVVVGAIASAIGIAIALIIDWFPADAAKQAKPIDTLYDVLMIVSVPVFVLVVVVTLFAVLRFRMRPGQERQDGPPIHGNTRLEVVWTALPAIVLVSLCSYAYVVLRDIEEKKPNALVVNVTGQQFAWRYAYPQDGGRAVETTQLVLPKDRPVLFKVRAVDVIHDFWVPAFRVKIDAVPGITTEVRATPTRVGTYEVVCAELCGLGHAVMRSSARVVTPAAYESWLAELARPAAPAGGGGGGDESAGGGESAGGDAAALGRETFVANCGSCHTLADAGTSGAAGPDLTTALRGQSEAEIREDIIDPDKRVEEGFQPGVMPSNFSETLSAEQIDGLVTYLASVSR